MPVIFQDKQFEKAVREVVGKSEGELTHHDLEKINSMVLWEDDSIMVSVPIYWVGDTAAHKMIFPNFIFDIRCSENGKWISDLDFFGHIRSLRIHAQIKNLSILKKLSRLEQLYITENRHEDWSPIQDLIYLNMLTIIDCELSNLDFNSLGFNQGSYYISLRYNQIEDITVFGNGRFSYLGRLFLKGNPIDCFSLLNGLELVMCDVPIEEN